MGGTAQTRVQDRGKIVHSCYEEEDELFTQARQGENRPRHVRYQRKAMKISCTENVTLLKSSPFYGFEKPFSKLKRCFFMHFLSIHTQIFENLENNGRHF